jgi:hypothetical protein
VRDRGVADQHDAVDLAGRSTTTCIVPPYPIASPWSVSTEVMRASLVDR